VPPTAWDSDDPSDAVGLAHNATKLMTELNASAPARADIDAAEVCRWHTQLYTGCRVPVPGYVGHFRGDATVPELVGYEIGVGPDQPDGFPDRVGVWSSTVTSEVDAFLRGVHQALGALDRGLSATGRAATPREIAAVVELAGTLHGEWLRVHPFANGNGRTARVWVGWLALRYRLPLFLSVKPRPHTVAYARASRASMGRPPDFVGDHSETIGLFANLLAEKLLS